MKDQNRFCARWRALDDGKFVVVGEMVEANGVSYKYEAILARPPSLPASLSETVRHFGDRMISMSHATNRATKLFGFCAPRTFEGAKKEVFIRYAQTTKSSHFTLLQT